MRKEQNFIRRKFLIVFAVILLTATAASAQRNSRGETLSGKVELERGMSIGEAIDEKSNLI